MKYTNAYEDQTPVKGIQPTIEEPLRTLLTLISKRVIVIGSVARGIRWPKDLDLLWDMDNSNAKELLNKNIKELGLHFESALIGAWTFRDYGWMVEIMGIHYGPGYKAVRRKARTETICGLRLLVAQAEDTPAVDKTTNGWIRWRT